MRRILLQEPTLAALLKANALQRPDDTAIVYRDKACSFAEHYQRAEALAGALAGLGCQAGDRVAVYARNCIGYLELYSACQLSGLVLVPVNFRLAPAELEWVCANTRPRVLFYTTEFEAAARQVAARVAAVQQAIRIDENQAAGDEYEALLGTVQSPLPDRSISENTATVIIHTSGTTGRPRGAVLSQGGLLGVAKTISADAGLTARDFGLLMQPLFHVGALFLYLAHQYCGAAIRLENGFQPARVWEIIGEKKITTMQLVPTMLAAMLDESPDADYPETALTTIFYSTAPIRESLLRRGLAVFGQVFLQQYGSTEAGQISSLARTMHITDGSPQQQRWLLSAGKVNPGVQLRIVDTQGRELGPGEAGEILVRNPWSMLGYWEDEAATEESLMNGYLRMGDIGYLDEHGFLYIVDRKKDMIISGGENIYPREVELALNRHPAVVESAVIGIPDERWGEAVLAVVVHRIGDAVTEEELIDFCRQEIASYKKPKKVEFVDALPRNSMGKVDKPALRRPRWQNQAERQI